MSLDFLPPQTYILCERIGMRRGCGFLTKGLAGVSTVHYISPTNAGIAQLVERNLAKVDVAGSNPVSRSVPGHAGTWGHSVIAPNVPINTLPL